MFLGACEEEAELTTFGRLLVSKMLASTLSNRIQLHRWALDHPEVKDERIVSPWIIVGLPRTGTSLLSMLLGLDPLARPLAPVGISPSHPARHAGGGGGGSPHRSPRQGPRGADEAQSPAQGHAPLRGHPGRGVRLALHVRRALHGARDAGPRPDVRALARAGRHDSRLRPTPPGPPDPAVAPADGTLDSQDAQPPLASRRHVGRLPGRPGHLDAPGPRTGRHLAGQPGQRGPAPSDQPGPTRVPPQKSGSANVASPCARPWPSTRRRTMVGASTSTTTP